MNEPINYRKVDGGKKGQRLTFLSLSQRTCVPSHTVHSVCCARLPIMSNALALHLILVSMIQAMGERWISSYIGLYPWVMWE